jgi:hypothetical protein
MKLTTRTLAGLLLFLAFLFGTLYRLMPVLQAGFPLNDGGLFYTMTSDLQESNYALPTETTYNRLNIPYSYPPIPFYLAAFVQEITGVELVEIIRWLPVIFSLLTIPAFFLLAKVLLENDITAALATLIFALIPRSYEWIIMGGGVTRAPATLFLILMIWGAYHLFHRGGWKFWLLTTISGALIILTHPERSLHAVVSAALLWFFFNRSWIGIRRALLVAGGVLLLTSPWWLSVLTRDGWTPFALAFQSGGQRSLFWSSFLLLDFTDEQIPLIVLLAVIGFSSSLFRKKNFLPFWTILAFLTDPRSAPHVISVQTSLLAALGLSDVILPALARLDKPGMSPDSDDDGKYFLIKRGRWFFGYLLIIMLVNVTLNIQTLGKYVLSENDRSALTWINENTPPESRFLVLTWRSDAMLTPLLEWFPALSERTNISTIQGREWLPGKQNFRARLGAFPYLHACLYEDADCLEQWAAQQDDTFEYVYISLASNSDQGPQWSALAISLTQSDSYQVVYQTPEVLIFAKH